jgi:hypothetical protein
MKSQRSRTQMPRKTMRSKSSPSLVRAARTKSRNKVVLVLFGRAAMTTLALFSGVVGFFAGIRVQAANYDRHTFAPPPHGC